MGWAHRRHLLTIGCVDGGIRIHRGRNATVLVSTGDPETPHTWQAAKEAAKEPLAQHIALTLSVKLGTQEYPRKRNSPPTLTPCSTSIKEELFQAGGRITQRMETGRINKNAT